MADQVQNLIDSLGLNSNTDAKFPSTPLRGKENTGVSMHLLSVWRVLRDSNEWLSNKEISRKSGVANRTARAHTHYLVGLGLLDMLEVSPARLYRLSESAEHRNHAAYQQLQLIDNVISERLG